ncbi:MAG: hypothetical protein SFY96_08055 [Planctomycetota bacterium]|nr:hypothetical protein [Planctomycetota bacterium]
MEPKLIFIEPPSGYFRVAVYGCNGSGLVAVGDASVVNSSAVHGSVLYQTETGTIATAVIGPPPGYQRCGFQAVSDDASRFFGWVSESGSTFRPAYYDNNGWHVMSTTANVRIRGCNPEGTLFFGSMSDGSFYRAAAFNVNSGSVSFLPNNATDGDTIFESEAVGGTFTENSIIAYGRGRGSDQIFRPIQFGVIPPFIFANKLANPSTWSSNTGVVCSGDGSRLIVNTGVYYGHPIYWTTNRRFSFTAPDPVSYVNVAARTDDPGVEIAAISRDGHVYAGSIPLPIDIYTSTPAAGRDDQYHRLWDLLRDEGVTIPGHYASNATAVNATGDRFWGNLIYSQFGGDRVFFAAVDVPSAPANCAADFNKDGFITFEDFDAFVAAFEAGC